MRRDDDARVCCDAESFPDAEAVRPVVFWRVWQAKVAVNHKDVAEFQVTTLYEVLLSATHDNLSDAKAEYASQRLP